MIQWINILVQYADILEERRDLIKRIEQLQNKKCQVIDSVKGSDKEFHYTERRYVVNGIDIGKESSINKLQKMFVEFEQQTKVEKFIDGITDRLT